MEEHLLDQDQGGRKHKNVWFAYDQHPLSLPPVMPLFGYLDNVYQGQEAGVS